MFRAGMEWEQLSKPSSAVTGNVASLAEQLPLRSVFVQPAEGIGELFDAVAVHFALFLG